MALTDLMVNAGDDLFYNPGFRNVMEDHMEYLRTRYSAVAILNPDEAYQWRGDFFGLLDGRGYNRKYHWIILRLNQYTSPLQFTEDTLAILVPDFAEIDRIAQAHQVVSKIS
jgi:hypothetical protein